MTFPHHHPTDPTPGYGTEPPNALDARIERLRTLARAEPRLAGVLLYGSWTVGEADAHSDIEAYVFLDDAPVDRADGRAAPHTHDGFDSAVFLQQLDPGRPLRLVHTNRFGVLTVVFEDLMRGEFHFVAASTGIPEIGGWRGMVHLPDPERAVLLDRTGQLLPLARGLNTHRPPEPAPTAQQCADELTNWTLMVAHLLARGELARAHAFLGTMVAPEQLKLCRLLRGTTAHWLTPSRALELDVPEADRARYAATTSGVEPDGLRRAARSSWAWSRELIDEAGARWNTGRSPALHRDLAGLLGD